jgi:hypothetical protein
MTQGASAIPLPKFMDWCPNHSQKNRGPFFYSIFATKLVHTVAIQFAPQCRVMQLLAERNNTTSRPKVQIIAHAIKETTVTDTFEPFALPTICTAVSVPADVSTQRPSYSIVGANADAAPLEAECNIQSVEMQAHIFGSTFFFFDKSHC